MNFVISTTLFETVDDTVIRQCLKVFPSNDSLTQKYMPTTSGVNDDSEQLVALFDDNSGGTLCYHSIAPVTWDKKVVKPLFDIRAYA